MGELFGFFELLGTIAFAVSGAMVAIDRRADVFGVVFLGMTTAIGGGIVRDCLLGVFPAAIFSNRLMLVTAAVCPLLVFLAAWFAGDGYEKRKSTVDTVNNLIDALGLGAFTVTGVRMGLAAGYGSRWFFVAFLGLVTGIGGGLLRDVMTVCTPFVLKKRVYALASIGGALCYLGLNALGLNPTFNGLATVALVFLVRLLATVFRWNLPRIERGGPAKGRAASPERGNPAG